MDLNFKVDIGGKKFTIKNDSKFNLALPVMKVDLNNETYVVQLISKNANGNLRIRFVKKKLK